MPDRPSPRVAWIMRKPRSLGNFSIETSYRTMGNAWPSDSPRPEIHTASRFTSGILDRLAIWNEVRQLDHPVLHITGDIGANVRAGFGLVNELATNGKLLHCEDWTVNRDASLELAGLSIGGFRCKSDVRTHFTASGGALTQAISVHGSGQRHVDHHIEIHHDVPHTDSSLNIHAACDDQSHSIATGLLTIAEHANHCDAGQVFKNLLLSEKARAEAIPELEVLADEVAAAHGAASAPVDQGQLHYLMSRGLDEESAVALLIEGFMQDGFSSLDNQTLVDEMRTRLTVHLECELKR